MNFFKSNLNLSNTQLKGFGIGGKEVMTQDETDKTILNSIVCVGIDVKSAGNTKIPADILEAIIGQAGTYQTLPSDNCVDEFIVNCQVNDRPRVLHFVEQGSNVDVYFSDKPEHKSTMPNTNLDELYEKYAHSKLAKNENQRPAPLHRIDSVDFDISEKQVMFFRQREQRERQNHATYVDKSMLETNQRLYQFMESSRQSSVTSTPCDSGTQTPSGSSSAEDISAVDSAEDRKTPVQRTMHAMRKAGADELAKIPGGERRWSAISSVAHSRVTSGAEGLSDVPTSEQIKARLAQLKLGDDISPPQ